MIDQPGASLPTMASSGHTEAEPSAPVRVQLSRAKGWRMPPNTVKVDRSTKWGNPFNFKSSEHCWTALSFGCRADPAGRQEASVRAFRDWIDPRWGRRTLSSSWTPKMRSGRKSVQIGPTVTAGEAVPLADIRAELGGKNLACWCRQGAPCHADVLLELANAPPMASGEADANTGNEVSGLNQ